MRPVDIPRICDIPAHALNPQGDRVVYELRTPKGEGYERRLWVSEVRPETSGVELNTGAGNAWAPSWSPDGNRIAFYRGLAPGAEGTELCVLDLRSGSVQINYSGAARAGFAVSDRHLRGATPPAWSPSGDDLLFPGLLANTNVLAKEPRWRRITSPHYLMDGRGYLADGTVHIYLASVGGAGQVRTLSDGLHDHWDASWHPDGRSVVAVRAQGDHQELVEYSLEASSDDGTGRVLASSLPHATVPTFSPDGRKVRFLGMDPTGGEATRGRNVSLLEVEVGPGTAAVHPLTDPESVDLDDPKLGPMTPAANPLVAAHRHGSTVLVSAMDDPAAPVSPSSAGAQVLGHDARGASVSAVVASATSAGDLYVHTHGRTLQLTDLSGAYRDVVVQPEEIWVDSSGVPVQCWLYLPELRQEPAPLVLLIHGGPDLQVGHLLDVDAQVLCSGGYAVLMANPRGSAGYGESHATAINQSLATVDVEDLLAVLAMARARPEVDASRVGVTGRSYGGFMSAWLSVSYPDLFQAAIPECGIYSWDSMVSTSDIGYQIVELVGPSPEQWVAKSPLGRVEALDAATMVIAYTEDRRTPVEQAQRYFRRLHELGKTAEMVVFDGGPHSFAVSGPPDARIARAELMVGWFDQHLRGRRSGLA